MDSEKQVEHQNNNNNNNKKNKKSINKENINSTFIYLDDLINKEIIKIRENPKITNSIKTLRVVNKSLKKINQMISKLLKNKKIDKTSNNNNGFMKLNNISNELSKFMNIDENEMKSRVDVTKYICSYIKNNNLQNPEDRREILPDLNLQKLFKINNDKIKYYNIQTLLKIHFPREG